MLKKPSILLLKYVLGFEIEYLTPACAAKLTTICGLMLINNFAQESLSSREVS